MKFLLLLLAAVSADHHAEYGICDTACGVAIFEEIWLRFADPDTQELARGLSAQDAAVYGHLLWKNWTFKYEGDKIVGNFDFVTSTMELIGQACGLTEQWNRDKVTECWSEPKANEGLEYWLTCDDEECATAEQKENADAYRWIAGVLANQIAPGTDLANAYAVYALAPEQISEGVDVLYTYGFIYHGITTGLISDECAAVIQEKAGYVEGEDDVFITIAENQEEIKAAADDAACSDAKAAIEKMEEAEQDAIKEWVLGAFHDRVEAFAGILEGLNAGDWDNVDKALVGYFTFIEPAWEWVMEEIGKAYQEATGEEGGPTSKAAMTSLVDSVTDEWITEAKQQLNGLTDAILWEHAPILQSLKIGASDIVASYKRVVGTIAKRFATKFDNPLVKWLGDEALTETQVNGAIAGYQTFKTIADSPILQIIVKHHIDEGFWDIADHFGWTEETGWDQFVGEMFAAGAYILDEVKKEISKDGFEETAAEFKAQVQQANAEAVELGYITQEEADKQEEAIDAFVADPEAEIEAISEVITASETETATIANKFKSDNDAKEEANKQEEEDEEVAEEASSAAIVSAAVALIAFLL